jgi:hypothetical protein
MTDGRVINNIKTRLDLQSQELHFIDKNKAEMAVPAGLMKSILFLDSPGSDKPVAEFRNGFPPIDQQDEHSFYQVLSSGKVGLLLFLQKMVSTRKNALSGEVTKEFISYETLYLFRGDKLERIKKDKDSILKALADRKEKMEAFAKDHKLRYKSFDEVRQLLDYYNSIP